MAGLPTVVNLTWGFGDGVIQGSDGKFYNLQRNAGRIDQMNTVNGPVLKSWFLQGADGWQAADPYGSGAAPGAGAASSANDSMGTITLTY